MWYHDLTNWFIEHQRILPWRETHTPYRTLVCEFMAQQTKIATLIPYYERWMVEFPTIADVAKANEDKVLKLWEGLGYYSRARNLHKTCKIIQNEMNGEIPSSLDDLLQLPGVGPYIAAAVASIAFEQPTPVIDGNVLRVLTRFFGLDDDITKERTKKKLLAKLTPIIKQLNPGNFNQAMMELGALVCTPSSPKCTNCPIQGNCYAFNYNETDKFPVKPKKAPIPHFTVVVGIIRNQANKFLITKRKKNQLLGGLWEFPGGKVNNLESIEAALHREIQEELRIDITVDHFLCKVNHAYSHFKITMHAYLCSPKFKDSVIDDITLTSAESFELISINSFNKVLIIYLINPKNTYIYD